MKHDELYMAMARVWAGASYCKRRKVGALVVSPSGLIISDGFNGAPSGFPNVCECDMTGETLPYVLHAEANAITKLARSTQSGEGAALYSTCAPCLECAKLIIQTGIARVVYADPYRDVSGLDLLTRAGVKVKRIYT